MQEVVIKIPEEVVVNDTYMQYLGCMSKKLDEVLHSGILIPKGHGDLIDKNELRCENTDFDTYNDYCLMFDEINNASILIEAEMFSSGHLL